jgi:chromosome partitioning protein
MRTAVMEGALADFDLASVMQVLSIGRQYTSVELFDESGNAEGTLVLKSGRILGAKSGSRSGIDAVSTLLRRRENGTFSVYRIEPLGEVAAPIGSVEEVLLIARESELGRVSVMAGSLTEFDLLNVLQVVSIGRQFTGVEVTGPDGRRIGRIELKAGQVVSATSEEVSGVHAIRRLLHSPPDSSFVVLRLPGEVGEQHLGSLAEILISLSDSEEAEWDPVEASTGSLDAHLVDQLSEVPDPAAPLDKRSHVDQPPVPRAVPPRRTAPVAVPGRDTPVVSVTSPKGGSGKTTVSLNLGIALARQGRRVILVDADFNGVLLALNSRPKSKPGAYEIAAGRAHLGSAICDTRVPKLRLVPSGTASAAAASSVSGWKQLFREAQAEADIVLVDTAAGARGPGGDACAASTHSVVVLPAEPAAFRALPAHLQRLEALANPSPKVVGILVNMLDYRAGVSIDVLRDLCNSPSAAWIFDIPIARSPAFMEAVAHGEPVCRGDRSDTPTIGWVFEMLASGIQDRLGMASPRAATAPPLVLD